MNEANKTISIQMSAKVVRRSRRRSLDFNSMVRKERRMLLMLADIPTCYSLKLNERRLAIP